MPVISCETIELGIETTIAKFFLSLQFPENLGGKNLTPDEAKQYINNYLYNIAQQYYNDSQDDVPPTNTTDSGVQDL